MALPETGPSTPVTHVLHQRLRYTYAAPVRELRHRLMVVPPEVHGGQHRLRHDLRVTGAEYRLATRRDSFGNHVIDVRAPLVAAAIEFEISTVVRHAAGPAGPGGGVGPVAVPVAPSAAAGRRYLRPSPLTRPDAALRDLARSLAGRPADGPLAFAERACAWAHGALRYQHDVTHVGTTAAEALAIGGGVCQDYAHLMVAVCRTGGVPARYVSGHLVGEGSSHAWVEVIVADPDGAAMAVAFDPTHDRRPGERYLTVAVGRDYGDVAPTSGTFCGVGAGVLRASKRLEVLEIDASVLGTAGAEEGMGLGVV